MKSHPGIHLSFSVFSYTGDAYEKGANRANPYRKNRERRDVNQIWALNPGIHCTRWSKKAAMGGGNVGRAYCTEGE